MIVMTTMTAVGAATGAGAAGNAASPTDTASASTSSRLETYLSLIQQYLAVFMTENAIFLAERCVAEYPHSLQAAYLLALGHYRLHNPKRARTVLDEHCRGLSRDGYRHYQQQYGDGENDDDNDATATGAAIRFLSAVCSYELADYSRAEESLLKDCRVAFLRSCANNNNNGASTAARSIDDWIVQTTPCPVPNGAAGLNLLGKICRKSNRLGRAVAYFRMSLQLDPFLWTSFEALCELGVTDDGLNPAEIFGVDVSFSGSGPAVAGASAAAGRASGALGSSILTPIDHHHRHRHHDTSMLAHSTPAPAAAAAATGGLPSNDMLRTRPLSHYSSLETPGLTPIPHHSSTTMQGSSSFGYHPTSPTTMNASAVHQRLSTMYETPHAPRSTASGAGLGTTTATPAPASSYVRYHPHPGVLKRARDVVSRTYYPPSPDASHAAAVSAAATTKTLPLPPSTTASSISTSVTAAATTPVTTVTRGLKYLQGLGNSALAATLETPMSTSSSRTFAGASTTIVAASAGAGADGGGQQQARSLFGATENRSLGAAANAAAASGSTGSNAAATMMTTATIGPGGGGAAHDGTSGEWETEKPACDSATAVATAEEANPLSSSVAGILELLSLLGAAYHKQCQFQCHAALDLLNRLPEKHQNTGWVLHQQGRAYLELNQFHEARKCLELMRSRDSGRMRGLELLSTVYWQLKKEVELAHLSQHVVDLDRLAPEAWCVVGNCFSLQKDHESALVFFRRSLQLDYDFTYTHTLSGYEYMANEDFDKAIACFRQALRIDERHYNAWYGLGAIYHRQEKYDVAEYHFAKAVSINPSSSVLRCNLGIAQNANGKPYQALDTLNAALRLDSRNPQARFQRATIYFALNQPENALDELRKVRDAAPREATIHFFMGRVLKKLGRLDEAMKCFLTAMDLDPKDNQLIKSAMDKLEEPDVEEETMSSF